jgi:dienelactone hydrolase
MRRRLTQQRGGRRAAMAVLLLAAAAANGAVLQREIYYQSGSVVLKGLLAYDDALTGKRPAVLVVHEWSGLDEHASNSARRLAEAGYVAFALDMYGEGRQAHHPKDAAALLTEVRSNLPLMQSRFDAARDLLRAQPNVEATRVAAIGYCFGGSVVLEMARAGADLRGVVSLHGALDTRNPAKAGALKAEVLVLTGGADPLVPADQVEALDRELRAAGARYKIVTYAGAKHSFTNPAATQYGRKFGIPDEYNADADRQSWSETLAFLRRVME